MKITRLFSLLAFIAIASAMYATPLFTPTIDGFKEAGWGASADAVSPNNASIAGINIPAYHSANASQDIFVTDDPTNLYIGYYYNGDVWAPGNSARLMFGFITNPAGNSGGSTDPWEPTTTFGAANRPDFFLRQWTEAPYDERMEFGGALGASSQTKGVAEFLKWDASQSQWIGAGSIIHYERLTTEATNIITNFITNGWSNTITLDNTRDFGESTEKFNCRDGKFTYFTWDSNKLYFGFTNQDMTANGQAYYIVISTNTNYGSASLPTLDHYEGSLVNLPNPASGQLKAQFLYIFKDDTSSTFRRWRDVYNGSWSSPHTDDPDMAASGTNGSYNEFSIKRSSIGSHTGKIYVMTYAKNLMFTGFQGPGYLYGSCPEDTGGISGTGTVTLTKWIEVDLSQNVAPNDATHIQPGGGSSSSYSITTNIVTNAGTNANNWAEIAIPLTTLGLKTGDAVKLFMYYRPDMGKAGYSDSTPWDPNASADGATGTSMNSNFSYTVRSDNVAPTIVSNTPLQNSTNDRKLDLYMKATDNMPFSTSTISMTVNGNAALLNGIFQNAFGYYGYIVSNSTSSYEVYLTNLSFLFEQQVNIILTVDDAAGNRQQKTYNFMVRPDTNAPVFFGESPSHLATGVAATAPISWSIGDDNQAVSSSLVTTVNGVSAYTNGGFQPGFDGPGSSVSAYPSTNGYTVTIDPTGVFSYRQTVTVTNIGADPKGNRSTNVIVFVVTPDNVNPSLANLSPGSGAGGISKAAAVTFDLSDDTAVLTNLLAVKLAGTNAIVNGVIQPAFTGSITATGGVYSVSVAPTNGYAYGQVVNVNVTYSDSTTNTVNSDTLFTVKADDVAPTLSAQNPANGAAGIARTNAILFTVDDDTAVNLSTLVVTVNGVTAVSGIAGQNGYSFSTAATNHGYRVTVTPPSIFNYNQAVTVAVTAQDSTGNSLSGSWGFTIKPDTVVPVWSSILPADGAINQAKAVTLSAVITDDNQINSATVRMTVNGVAAVTAGAVQPAFTGSVTVSGSGYALSVAPTNGFGYRNHVAVTNIASDLAGNAATNVSAFDITPDNVGPSLTALYPANGAGGVSKSAVVSFDLSDDTAVLTNLLKVQLGGVNAILNGVFQGGYTGSITAASGGYSVSVAPTNGYAYNQSVGVKVIYHDTTTNTLTNDSLFTVKLDNVAPTLADQNPGSGAPGIARTNAVLFTLDDDTAVNLLALDVKINGVDAVIGGAQKAGFAISTVPTNHGYRVTVDPTAVFNYDQSVTVWVSGSDNAGNTNTGTWSFTVASDTVKPSWYGISPNNGANNQPKAVTLSSVITDDNQINSSTVTMTVNGVAAVSGGSLQPGFTGSVTASGSGYALSVAPTAGFGYRGHVTVTNIASDIAGNAATNISSFDVTADNILPSLGNLGPANAAINVAKSAAVSFDLSDDSAVLSNLLCVKLSGASAIVNGVIQNAYTGSITANGSGYFVTVWPTNGFAYGQTVGVEVVYQDTTTNTVTNNSSFNVKSDDVIPTLSAQDPANGASGVARTNALLFMVDDDTQVKLNTLALTVNGVTAVSGGGAQNGYALMTAATNNGYLVTVTPPSLFNHDQTVSIALSVQDGATNQLSGSWSFSTGPDWVFPVISGISPADGANGVARSVSIVSVITDDNQIGLGSVNVTINGVSAVSAGVLQSGFSGTVNALGSGYSVSVKPAAGFNWRDHVVVTNLAADLAGNGITNVSSFNVMADNIAPAAGSFVPDNLATGVQKTASVNFLVSDDTRVLSNLLTLRVIATNTVMIATNGVAAIQNGAVQPGFSGSVSASGSNCLVSVTPAAGFQYGQTVNAWAVFADTTSNTVTNAWSFRIKDDDLAPTLLSVSPTNQESGAGRLGAISFVIDDDTAINFSSFNIKVNGADAVKNGIAQGGWQLSADISNRGYSVTLTPQSPFTYEQGVSVYLFAEDSSHNPISSSWTYSVLPDTTAPVFFGESPSAGAVLAPKNSAIVFTAGDNHQVSLSSLVTTINGVSAFSNGSFQTGYNGIGSLVSNAGATNGYTIRIVPETPFVYRGTVTVSNFAADPKGNGTNSVWSFTVTPDNVKPAITLSSPTNGAVNVAKTASVIFDLSDDSAVLTNRLLVLIAGTNAVSGGVVQPGFSGSILGGAGAYTVTLAPTNGFSYGQTVNVRADFADATTNTNTAAWSFSIKLDDIPPFIVSVNPTNRQSGLARATSVAFMVDDDTAIDLSRISVKVNGSDAVKNGSAQAGWLFSANPTNRGFAVTVTPQTPFAYDQTVSVFMSAEDSSGNPINSAWSFNIKSDDVAPSVSNAAPSPSAVSVADSASLSIVVWDDSAVDSSTVTVSVNGTNALSGGIFAAGWDGALSRMNTTANGVSILIDPTTAFGYRSVNSVSVSAADLRGNAFSSNWSFTVQPDNIAPFFSNVLPIAGAQGVSRTPTFSFDTGDNTGALLSSLSVWMVTNSVTNIAWSNGAAQSGFTGSAVTNALGGHSITLQPVSNFVYNLGVRLFGSISDGETNTASLSGWNFTIQSGDSNAPTLSRFLPGNGEDGVEPDTLIGFETADNVGVLSNAIHASIRMPNGANLVAITNGGFVAPFDGPDSRITTNANHGYDIFIDPISNLLFTNSYQISVHVGDSGANAASMAWYFTVRGPDVTPPSVEQIVPRDGSTDIPVSASLSFMVADNYGVQSNQLLVTLNGAVVLSNGLFDAAYKGPGSSFTANNRKGWSVIIDPLSDFAFGGTVQLSIKAVDTSTNVFATNIGFRLQESQPARAETSVIDPKRGSSAVKIKINRTGFAEVAIYNIRGEKVKGIPQRYYNIGDTVDWDGTILDTGAKVGSGVYFIKIFGTDMNGLVKVSIVQ